MKLKFFPLAIFLFLLGCDDHDAALLEKMKTDFSEATQNLPDTENLQKQLTDLQTLMNAAPDELRNSQNFGATFSELSSKIGGLGMKTTAMQSQLLDMDERMAALISNYESKKISTADAKIEYETAGSGLVEAAGGLRQAEQEFDVLSTEYAKMMASWRAEIEK